MTLHQIEVFHVYPFFNTYYSVDEFDLHWNKMLLDYNAENNEWAKALYSLRHQWVDTHLRGSYFGGSTAINRCKSMNVFSKDLWMRNCHYGGPFNIVTTGWLPYVTVSWVNTPLINFPRQF